jgi:putative flavoprotein involved in K+ transport
VLEVSNVIWCTGFTPRFDWIEVPVFAESGFPVHHRGIVDSQPGLYFMGLLFLHSISSALLGGVGRDAEHIVGHIAERRRLQDAAGTARNR